MCWTSDEESAALDDAEAGKLELESSYSEKRPRVRYRQTYSDLIKPS